MDCNITCSILVSHIGIMGPSTWIIVCYLSKQSLKYGMPKHRGWLNSLHSSLNAFIGYFHSSIRAHTWLPLETLPDPFCSSVLRATPVSLCFFKFIYTFIYIWKWELQEGRERSSFQWFIPQMAAGVRNFITWTIFHCSFQAISQDMIWHHFGMLVLQAVALVSSSHCKPHLCDFQ